MKKYLLLLFVVALFTSCAKTFESDIAPVTLKSITLNKDTLTMSVGSVVQINLTLSPSTFDNNSLIWSSSDSTIVAVKSGTIRALKVGISKVFVSNQDKTVLASCLVTVIPIQMLPKPDSLKIGLIAYYPFNNNALDSSGNENHGTVYSLLSVNNRFGKPNSAYYFNGTNSYIKVKDKLPLRLTSTDFTINTWVNLDEYTTLTGSALLEKNNGPFQNGWNCSVTGYGSANTNVGKVGRAFYNVSGGNDPFAVGGKTVEVSKWVMITTIYSMQKQEIKIYINGILDTVTPNIPTPNANTSVDLFIGKNSFADPSGLTPAYQVKGMLDDIRIYGRILSTTEIVKLFNLSY